jgi:hypothetical protein
MILWVLIPRRNSLGELVGREVRESTPTGVTRRSIVACALAGHVGVDQTIVVIS